MNNIQIRRKILKILYDAHNQKPNSSVALDELVDYLKISPQKIQCNLTYLADPDKKLIQIHKTSALGKIYHFSKITASGIDLIENPSEFNRNFSQIIYQYIGRDKVEVTIGDHNSDIIVGNDIIKLQFGLNNNLEEICNCLLVSLKKRNNINKQQEKEVIYQLKKLQNNLKYKEIDLGKMQKIKQSLINLEGKLPAATTALFSHPSIATPIRHAVEKLIGHEGT